MFSWPIPFSLLAFAYDSGLLSTSESVGSGPPFFPQLFRISISFMSLDKYPDAGAEEEEWNVLRDHGLVCTHGWMHGNTIADGGRTIPSHLKRMLWTNASSSLHRVNRKKPVRGWADRCNVAPLPGCTQHNAGILPLLLNFALPFKISSETLNNN